MYIELINPVTHEKSAYTNGGSSAQTLNCLNHEAVGEGQEAQFFGAGDEELSADELQLAIDAT